MHCIGGNSNSIIDVGTGMAPYLEWFDWIDNKLSVDLQSAYRSERVQGYEGSIFDSRFDAVQFDICTCLQVLEHVREPAPFARRLLSLSPLVLVSVPYQWPKGKTAGHVNDPVTLKKLNAWFDAEANWYMKVSEPFAGARATRLFAIYCRDPDRRFGLTTWRERKQS